MVDRAPLVEILWGEEIGTGVIDSHYDAASGTVSAGDLSGRIVIFDTSAAEVDPIDDLGMPVWGVAHQYREDELLVAAALADKAHSKGALVITDGSTERRIPFETPCWDVVISGDAIIWTMWDGRVGWLHNKDDPEPQYLTLPGAAYGLSVCGEQVLAVASADGIHELSMSRAGKLNHRRIYRARSVCYNVTRREADGAIFSGSSDGIIVTNSENGRRIPKAGNEGMCAVAVIGDLFLSGSLDGRLRLFAPDATNRALAEPRLPGGIWNISVDSDRGAVFIACGDGSLYCASVTPGSLSKTAVTFIESTLATLDQHHDVLNLNNPLEVAIATSFLEDRWSNLMRVELEHAQSLLTEWKNVLDDDRLNFLLASAHLANENFHESVICFQSISRSSSYFASSLEPLSTAFENLGLLSSAARVLIANLESISEGELPGALFRIGRIQEQRGDGEKALQAYENLSLLDHSHPGLQEALSRLTKAKRTKLPSSEVDLRRPQEYSAYPSVPETAGPTTLGSRRRAEYDVRTYLQYEAAGPADDAKKVLEAALMASVLNDLERRTERHIALDIGCATGRWPLWIARRGYEAHGYDISDASIEICKGLAERSPDLSLHFEKYNIANGAIHENYFSIVTCMMGTFNHIPDAMRPSFLSGIASTLHTDGIFAFSTWNVDSPFCDFLRLDGLKARDELKRNALNRHELDIALATSGLRLVEFRPFCYLPNLCYEVWEDDLANIELVASIDSFLGDVLTDGRPQMVFCVAEHLDR